MAHSSVTIQITPESRPTTPSWMGEVAAVAQILAHAGILQAVIEQVRFARARFGQFDLIDFVVVLIGYALSGESTRLSFYERLAPWASPFMALFGRHRLPHRSTLSRFLAALDQASVEAFRILFHKDLLARKPFPSLGGLFDRTGGQWLVIDVDGTRQAARQRALPQTDALPAPHRRFEQVCAPGYQGRKRGEVVRTRTVVLQTHTHQFLGTFAGPGNGDYRGELRRVIGVISSYATQLGLPTPSLLVRLDGLYGDAAPFLDVLMAGLAVIARSRAYHLLDLGVVQQVLTRAPAQISHHPESGMTRALYDCPAVPLTPAGPQVRLVVATHAAPDSAPAVGTQRDGMVYELFVSTLPSPRLRPRMCWICICIAARSRPCWPMKTTSRSPTDGILIPRAARSLPRSSPSGSGISAWSWGRRFLHPNCARPNLLRLVPSNRFTRASLRSLWSVRLSARKRLRRMDLLNGPAHPLPMASLVPLLLRNPMGRSAALPPTRSISRSDVLSVMAPCGCCTLHASAIAVPGLLPRTVSRKQHHDQTATGECSVVANRLLTARLRLHLLRWTSTISCSRALARLASLPHPASMADARPSRNRRRDATPRHATALIRRTDR